MKLKKLTPKTLQRLKQKADKYLSPITYKGKKYYVLMVHPSWIAWLTKSFYIPPKKKGKKK